MANLGEAIGALSFFKGIEDQKYNRAKEARDKRIMQQRWTFGQLTDQWSTATGAQREHIAKSMQFLYNTSDSGIKQALLPYLRGGPVDPIQVKLAQFDKLHQDKAPRVTVSPEEDPAMFGLQTVQAKKFKNMRSAFAGLPEEPITPFVFSNSKGQTYLTIPDAFGAKVIPFEYADAERIAKEYDMTGAALLANGGEVVDAREIINGDDGQYLYEFRSNKLKGGERITKEKLNNYVSGSGGAGGIKGPRKLDDDLTKAFAALEAGKPKAHNGALGLDKFMNDVLSRTEDNTDEQREQILNYEVNAYLKNKDANFNYRVVGAKYKDYLFMSPSQSRGKKFTVLAAPGQRTLLRIGEDFKPVHVFMDRYDGRELFYAITDDPTFWGRLLGTRDEAIMKLRQAALQSKQKAAKPIAPQPKQTKLRFGFPRAGKEPLSDIAREYGD